MLIVNYLGTKQRTKYTRLDFTFIQWSQPRKRYKIYIINLQLFFQLSFYLLTVHKINEISFQYGKRIFYLGTCLQTGTIKNLKMSQIKRMKAHYHIKQGVRNTIEALIFYLTHFRSLGQKSKNNFVRFFVQMRTRKFALETY